MQEVKIYDFDFNLIASDFKCISLDWDVRFNSIGSFEGVFTLDSPIYKACSENEFTVCVQGENQGIVTTVNVKDDRIIVSGKSMNYILEKRICMPFSSDDYGYEMTGPEIVTKLVQKHCGDFMETLAPPQIQEKQSFVKVGANPLSEIIIGILREVNCGHYVKFDLESKKWVFGCRLPEFTDVVLSRPDNTLENCDYVRSVNDYAICGVYRQKVKYMGQWNAETNNPMLFDEDPDNFAKVYLISESGVQFGRNFNKGNYVICTDLSGKLVQDNGYGDFWYKIYSKDITGTHSWETVLSCEDIQEAKEMLRARDIYENVTAITRGVNQKELKVGDVVQIRMTSGEDAMVFAKQIKRVLYHYEWGNCYVKPVFYKMKENEDEQL